MPESRDKTKYDDRTRFASVIENCRDMALVFIDAQFAELFEQSGPVLLDFAERAENNALQGRFFEAMGLLRQRRPDIEHIFRLEVNRGFDRFSRMGRLRDDDNGDTSSDSFELSLVEPDEMEESVACENLVVRANASFFPDLYALGQRLTVINGGIKLKDSEIPASPHHLVRSFRRSMDGLDVEVKVKVILYALFDRFVVRQLSHVYDDFNRRLKEAGVLPNLKPVKVRSEGGKGAQARRAKKDGEQRSASQTGSDAQGPAQQGDAGASPSLATELFDSILGLMAKRRPGGDGAVSDGLAAPASPELLSAISKVQAQPRPPALGGIGSQGAAIPNVEIDVAFIDRVKDTLGQERQQILEQVDKDKLSPVDADLIDLIGMLFEYMLNDPVLPNSAKALLSHLHTPYLKVALIDRRLLVDSHHPARRLLDQMVEAGSLWVEEGNPNRGIFPAMQKTVDRVLLEFNDNVGLFDELLASFEQAMQEQRRRIETMEQRTQETARGRERLQLARQQAVQEIRSLITSHALPKPVVTFLNKVWTDHLVFTLLRDPEQGESWQAALGTAQDLVALFAPQQPDEPTAERQARIRTVRERINQQAQALENVNRSALDALLALLDQPETWTRPDMLQTPEAGESGLPPSEALATQDDDEDLSAEERELVERLRKMRFGTWFELSSEADGKPRRIKLSWMSPLTSTCMFVDRSGMQAEIRTLRELAQEILAGRAKVIPPPKHPFIDRALVSIRKMLQGNDKEAGETTASPPQSR